MRGMLLGGVTLVCQDGPFGGQPVPLGQCHVTLHGRPLGHVQGHVALGAVVGAVRDRRLGYVQRGIALSPQGLFF